MNESGQESPHLPSTLEILMFEIQKFSDAAFGDPTQRDCTGPLTHLQDEVQELIDNTDDKHEWADCMLLLLDAARRKGITPEQYWGYCLQKLEINKTRIWEKADGKNVYYHKK